MHNPVVIPNENVEMLGRPMSSSDDMTGWCASLRLLPFGEEALHELGVEVAGAEVFVLKDSLMQ